MGKRKTEQRIKAVELHKKGFPKRQIAELLGVNPASVKTWIAMYRNRQEGLLVDRSYGKAYSQKLKLEAVQAHLRDGRSLSEVTISYGISAPSLLKRWRKEYR